MTCFLKESLFLIYQIFGMFLSFQEYLFSFAMRDIYNRNESNSSICLFRKALSLFSPLEAYICSYCLSIKDVPSDLIFFFKSHQSPFNVEFNVSVSCCCVEDQGKEEKHVCHYDKQFCSSF